MNKKVNGYWIALAIMSVFLLISCTFTMVQSYYILRLNLGRVGNNTYQSTTRVEKEDNETQPMHREDLPEPWFNLEDAASSSNPDKVRLSTTEIAYQVSPATVSLYLKGEVAKTTQIVGAGSGFIITPDGYIVTNAHVVESVANEGHELFVGIPGYDSEIPAQVIGMDEQTDIAVVKLTEGDNYPCVTLGDSDELQTGELVVAIGNALGTLEGTVTVGVVSSTEREIKNNGYSISVIQTDAAINEGNSGGPLINSFGEVIGVTNAKMVTSTSEGLGFAIPITSVKGVIESLINYGVVVNRPFLGVTVSQVDENSYYGAIPGVYVMEYVKGGPGDQAKFVIGDRIISMDGIEINASSDIIDVRDSHQVGDAIPVIVERDGKEVELTLVIGDSADYEGNATVTESTEKPDEDETHDDEKPDVVGEH